MLTALLDDVRVYAARVEKGPVYLCPGCRAEMVLKKGAIRVHHFAHPPALHCGWSRGETAAHIEAKDALLRALAPRSLRIEAEWPVASLDGDRRADLFVWDMSGAEIAVELQHTAVTIAEIEARTAAYMAAGIAVLWLPFLSARYRAQAEMPGPGEAGDWVVEGYVPRPFERWLGAFGFGDIWYYAVRSAKLMRGRFDPIADRSARRRRLRLWGPYDPAILTIRRFRRRPAELGRYRFPGGPAASLSVPARADKRSSCAQAWPGEP